MRDIFLVIAVIGGLGVTLRFPFVGVLLWTWFTCQAPHQEAFGFARSLPLNFAITVVTVLALLFSRERKLPRMDATLWLILAFLVWMTIASFFAVDPDYSWVFWDRVWRVFALGLLIAITATDRVRVHAIVWVAALSLLHYGVKGGLFTLTSGGGNHVLGPPHTVINDNNQLALALLMIMPLANYLRMNSAKWWVSYALMGGLVMTFISILGSYSRGAYLACAGLVVVAWWRSKNKLLYPLLVAAVAIPALYLMPQSFFDRVGSINDANTDASVQGRLVAWQVAYRAAVDHFPFGVGFDGAQRPAVFNRYFPDETTHAAHSIYFQVLGDIGFVGLALYLAMIALVFMNCFKVMRAARDRPELYWARDLASMIQLSMFAFCVGGAALSMAYYDVFAIYLGLLSALRNLTKPSKVAADIAFRPRRLAPAE